MKRHHLREHISIESRPYRCQLCSYSGLSAQDLKSHRLSRTHTGERPFPCNICDKLFRLKSSRNKHIRNHANNHDSCISEKGGKRQKGQQTK